jgi:hypothetical protein
MVKYEAMKCAEAYLDTEPFILSLQIINQIINH